MIAMITALSDPQKALEITNSIEYPMHKMAASAFIAKRLIESNHQTVALKIITKAINMPKSGDYQKNSIPVLKVLALMELDRKNAIELAKDMAENDYCEIGHKVKALTELAKIEAKYDLENAKELLEQAITVSRPSRFLLTSYHNLIKVAAKLDPAKLESIIKATLEKINSMEIVDLKFAIKGHFLNDLFLFNSL